MEIVGVRIESGVYNEKPWKKYLITCTHDQKDGEFEVGTNCYVFSIKGQYFEDLLSDMDLSIKDIPSLFGKKIKNFYYDKYQKINSFTLGD